MKKAEIESAITHFETALKLVRTEQEQDISYHITIADGFVALAALREAMERLPILEWQRKCKEHKGRQMNYFCPFCGFNVKPIPKKEDGDKL